MSSITASDRARQNDELRQNREDYQSRESEKTKQHKKEVKRLLEQHNKEVEEIKEAYQARLDDLRQGTRSSLSEKDVENQAKIEKLRGMYNDQLKKKTEQHTFEKDLLVENYEGELNKTKSTKDQQTELQKNQFFSQLAEKEKVYGDLAQKSRETMQESLKERTAKLNEKHSDELKVVTNGRDRQLSEATVEKESTKSALQGRIKDLERQSSSKLGKVEDHWMEVYSNQQKAMSAELKNRDMSLQGARTRMHNENAEVLNTKLQQLEGAHESLKGQVGERLDNKVRSTERELSRLTQDRLIERNATKRMTEQEKKNLVMAYEDRMEDLERQKAGIFGEAKEVTHKRVRHIANQAEHVLNETTRTHKQQSELNRERNKEDRAMMESQHRVAQQHLKRRTEDRINKVVKLTAESTENQQQSYKESLEQLKNSFSDRLGEQREAQMGTLRDAYLRMDEKFKNSEIKNTKKLEQTIGAYESKINEIDSFYKKELKRQEEVLQQRMKNQEKAHQVGQKTENVKFDTKLEQLRLAHEKEIERLEKRHHEQLATLSNRLAPYSKKA